jgi:hypothetical protein
MMPNQHFHRKSLRINELEFDFERHVLSRRGQVQKLNELQWNALVLMLDRTAASNATVSHGELAKTLHCQTGSTVRKNISVIRSAVGIPGCIPNQYGEGYRLFLPTRDAHGLTDTVSTGTTEVRFRNSVLHYVGGRVDDLSGMGNYGSICGQVGCPRGGPKEAFGFQGTGYIIVPDSPSLRLSSFTLTVWVKLAAFAGSQRILEKGASTSYWFYVRQDGTVVVGFYDGQQLCNAVSRNAVTLERWTLLTGTYDGSSLKCYIDGNLECEEVFGPAAPFNDDAPLVIGWKRPGIQSDRFMGLIAEIEIFNDFTEHGQIVRRFEAGVNNLSGRRPAHSAPG